MANDMTDHHARRDWRPSGRPIRSVTGVGRDRRYVPFSWRRKLRGDILTEFGLFVVDGCEECVEQVLREALQVLLLLARSRGLQ